jgi:hypothetical protein
MRGVNQCFKRKEEGTPAKISIVSPNLWGERAIDRAIEMNRGA